MLCIIGGTLFFITVKWERIMDAKSDRNVFSIDLSYDDGTWCSTSEDIPGLFLESESLKEFLQAVQDIAPYLIEKNLNITEDEIVIELNVQKTEPVSTEMSHSLKPTYTLNDEALRAVAMAY